MRDGSEHERHPLWFQRRGCSRRWATTTTTSTGRSTRNSWILFFFRIICIVQVVTLFCVNWRVSFSLLKDASTNIFHWHQHLHLGSSRTSTDDDLQDLQEEGDNKNNNDSVGNHTHLRPLGSSRLEPSEWPEFFFPMRNVCFTKTQIHFFQDPKDNQQKTGVTAMEFYEQHKIPPEIFYFWGQDKQYFHRKPHMHKMTMDRWMHFQNKRQKHAFLYRGTSFIMPPHLPHNMFHLFNELIIPLFQVALMSSSVVVPPGYEIPRNNTNTLTNTNTNTNTPQVSKNQTHLFLLQGNPDFYDKRVIMFDVLHKLFDNVVYPLEKYALKTRAVCFERFVWIQKLETHRKPFYTHWGRFDSEHGNHLKGVVPALRDAINQAYDIQVPDNKHQKRLQDNYKPVLVWASRTGEFVKTCNRCIVNEYELLEMLRKRFDVRLLPIMDRRKSRETNLKDALQIMATADMLGGLHGAGLGHGIFLQHGAPLFEMKDRTRVYNLLYMNMANLNDVGYYAFDTRPFEESRQNNTQRFYLDENAIEIIADGLWDAWQEEANLLRLQEEEGEEIVRQVVNDTCQFPEMEDLVGKVSSFQVSRCYLESRNGKWRQRDGIPELKKNA